MVVLCLFWNHIKMPLNLLQNLIDKQDNIEIIRDQIAFILVTESANQIALATTAGKPEPDDWKLRVYTEASNPLEQWLNIDDENIGTIDKSPIIDIRVDTSSPHREAGDVIKNQPATSTYFIDCYGLGISEDVAAGGHKAGDQVSALEAQKAVRLVRNILMAAQQVRLQLPAGIVGRRWVESVTYFQPEIDNIQTPNIYGARMTFTVYHDEVTQEFAGENIEKITIEIKRKADGKIILEAEYPIA